MNMKSLAVVIVTIAVLIVVGAMWTIAIKNGLITQDEGVKEAWAQIDTQLQRRADLIPNLVNTVKGYAAHEKKIFETVANARARLLAAQGPAEKGEAAGVLNSALGRLLAIAENYPQLKADNAFVRLQDELAGTENRIAVARIRYNDAVKRFNLAIRRFPGSLFASRWGFRPAEYFEVSAAATAVPEVKFRWRCCRQPTATASRAALPTRNEKPRANFACMCSGGCAAT